jgi:hypothetical protein
MTETAANFEAEKLAYINEAYASINAFCADVQENEKTLDVVARLAFGVAHRYKDIEVANRLVKGLGKKNAYARACVLWFTKFTPIRWNGDGMVGLLPPTAKTFTDFDIKGATETRVMDLAPDVKPYVLSEGKIMAALMGLAKKIEKAENGDATVEVHGNLAAIKARLAKAIAAAA